MCGIVGYSALEAPRNFSDCLELISHRGPDSSGIYEDLALGAGLGHRRLSILDTSEAGYQPIFDEDANLAMVYNGEIYNFRELREAHLEDVAMVGNSDTEVLLKLYARFGADVLPMLRGIYAFSILHKDTGEVFLARDAMGIKPLYYHADDKGVVFGSELKALLPMVESVKALNPLVAFRHLMFVWAPGEETVAQGFNSLAPGHLMRLAKGQIVEKRCWYRLPTFTAKSRRRPQAEAICEVADHLQAAVRRQLVSDVPLGSFLSGGLDSTSVVAFARKDLPRIQCFTIDAPDSVQDGFTGDLPYARQAAKHLDVPLEVVPVDGDRMVEDLVAMVLQLDEPLADPAALNAFYISRRAREMGYKVLLSGAGGDDVFTGYRRHQAIQLDRFYNWLPKPILGKVEQFSQALDQRRPLSRRLAKLFRGVSLPLDQRILQFFCWIDFPALRALMTPQLRDELSMAALQAPMADQLADLPTQTHPIERMLLLEQRFFLPDHNLIYTDRMSMAAGIEVRVPFLDEDLVEFAATIPSALKQKGRIGKWILKKAMEPHLPHDIIYRPKTGFGAPLRRWIGSELRPLIDDVLSQDRLTARAYFDAAAVRALIERNLKGEIDASYTIFSILCIEIWCRCHIDGDPEYVNHQSLSRQVFP